MLLDLFNSWQLNFIGYLICAVVFNQFYKLSLREVKRDGAVTILLQAIAGLSVLMLAPLFPLNFPSEPRFYLLLAVACVFYALSDRLQTTTRKNLEVSTYSILNQLSYVFLIFIGIAFFGEAALLNKFIGAFLIIGGNALIFYKKGFQTDKYALLTVLARIIFSIAISIDIGISKQFNLPIYIMITLLLPAFFIMTVEKINPLYSIREMRDGNKLFLIITGLAWGTAIFFLLRAFQLGKVTVVGPLQGVLVLANVVAAYLFLRESDNLKRKIIAAALVIVGIYTITAF